MTCTMAWSTLLLTLLAHCTGDWRQEQVKEPWEDMWVLHPALLCTPQHHSLCVSPPCSVLGPVCADSAILCVGGPWPDGHHLLHWKQLQHRAW